MVIHGCLSMSLHASYWYFLFQLLENTPFNIILNILPSKKVIFYRLFGLSHT